MAATEAAARDTRLRPVPLLAVIVGVAILSALGVWQVQRLHWKEALLARIAALQTAPAEPLDVVLNRIGPTGRPPAGQVDFVRVQADCPTLQETPTLHLYALVDGVLGHRLITSCPLAGGRFRSLLVDRGFVDEDHLAAVRPGPSLARPVVGILRRPEPTTWISPANDPDHDDWRSRDIPLMARYLHAPGPAPVMLMLERPGSPPPGPKPAPLPTDIPNNHLGYALTWFGLAAALVGVYVASLRQQRRA